MALHGSVFHCGMNTPLAIFVPHYGKVDTMFVGKCPLEPVLHAVV